jgi:hypothetical protein
MSFAQIQLPVIKQSAQQSSHHIRSSQHSSVVARDSGNTLLHPSTLIALHFSDICPIDSTVLAVELYPDVDLISYQYTDSATHYSYPEVYHREHGCTIEMSDTAQSCTVKFSFEFLVELAQRGIEAALPSCCNRVESVGTQHEGASGHCALRLCENISLLRHTLRTFQPLVPRLEHHQCSKHISLALQKQRSSTASAQSSISHLPS